MTPEERADKIIDKWCGPDFPSHHIPAMMDSIVAEIRSAVNEAEYSAKREAIAACHEDHDNLIREAVQKHLSPCEKDELHQSCQCITEYICRLKAETYEDAAKIIEHHTFDCDKVATSVNQLIAKIRARAPELTE